LTTMRSGAASAAWSTAAFICPSSVTSAGANWVARPSSLASAWPFSSSRSTIVTTAPRAVSRRTVASPSPDAPPVTSAPASSICITAESRSPAVDDLQEFGQALDGGVGLDVVAGHAAVGPQHRLQTGALGARDVVEG